MRSDLGASSPAQLGQVPDGIRIAYERLVAEHLGVDAVNLMRERQKEEQRLCQEETLQRVLDAIVWEWDNPYVDPGDWRPLEEE
jgi:hypothetical protein